MIYVDQPATYQIVVQGTLDPSWADTFGDLHIEHHLRKDGAAITLLTGEVTDQAALAGVLNLTHMLGMPLLSVSCLFAGDNS
ncbi:MAG: hypothetical protein IPK16_23470 [Anaerolineales bacterium]|nr:hypothetical protein [Anaerolineales bacterium]